MKLQYVDLRLLELRHVACDVSKITLIHENLDKVIPFFLRFAICFQRPALYDLMDSARQHVNGGGVVHAQKDNDLSDGGGGGTVDPNIILLESLRDPCCRALRRGQFFQSQDSLDGFVTMGKSSEILQSDGVDDCTSGDSVPYQAVVL